MIWATRNVMFPCGWKYRYWMVGSVGQWWRQGLRLFPLLAFAIVKVDSVFRLAAEWLLQACSVRPVAQSCLILWDPLNCNPSGSSAHGNFQARMLSGLPFPSPGCSRYRLYVYSGSILKKRSGHFFLGLFLRENRLVSKSTCRLSPTGLWLDWFLALFLN